ncbi:mtDNA inheritance, partitioning of the mitochondrial organelle [Arachnomyces sp. PD_36]|nr:mtDNA inheritance, partitioning of the mitochondrial organelle [Arachnomyces sp. PD_36]
MHEIITLQLGQRSNYLATHFWNIQESYFTYSEEEQSPVNHDIHFRPGVGIDGSETYTPRAVIYDLKGAFGSLRKHNALYEIQEESTLPRGLWDGNEVIQQHEPIPQSEYQKSLDRGITPAPLTPESVRYWSDYNRVFYHPKSIVQLNEYELNSKLMPFEDWQTGEELFRSLDTENDLLDRDIRSFAEECDQLRAFQVFTGADDAWGGFSARYIDKLRDEYGKKSVWVWALEDGLKSEQKKQALKTVNIARSMNDISPQVSAYIPISDPPRIIPGYLRGILEHEWVSSALISSAVETISLPTRLGRYEDFESSLAHVDSTRNIFKLQSTILPEKPANKDQAKETEEDEDETIQDDMFDIDFMADGTSNGKKPYTFSQIRVSRGWEDDSKAWDPTKDPSLSQRRQQRRTQHLVHTYHTSLGLPVLDSFPGNLFPHTVQDSPTASIRAALSSTSQISERTKTLQRLVNRAVPIDERETLSNGLGEIGEAYEEGWQSDSDDSDD